MAGMSRWTGLMLLIALVISAVILDHRAEAGGGPGVRIRTATLSGFGALGAVALDTHTRRVFLAIRPVPGDTVVGRVDVLDSTTGALIRRLAVGGGDGTQLLAVDEAVGHVYVTASDGTTAWLRILDARKGRLLRTVSLGTAPRLGPVAITVDQRASRVLVVSANIYDPTGEAGSVSVLDARAGRLLRTVTLGETPGAVIVDERAGRAFILDHGTFASYGEPTGHGSVYVLETASGRLLRITSVGPTPIRIVDDPRAGRVIVLTPSATAQNGIPLGGGSVWTLDARSGLLVRATRMGGNPAGLVVDRRAGHALVVTTAARGHAAMVSVLDTRSGQLLGRTMLDIHGHVADFVEAPSARGDIFPQGGPAGMGVVDERHGRAFFVNSNGPVVSVLDTRSGRLLVTAALGPTNPPILGEALGTVPALLALASPTGDIVVTNPEDGSISLLDGATAMPRQTIAVGGLPIAMLVDERHGATLIITLNGRISVLQRPGAAPPSHPSITFACTGSLHAGVRCQLAGHRFHPAERVQITYHIAVGVGFITNNQWRRTVRHLTTTTDSHGAFTRQRLQFALDPRNESFEVSVTVTDARGDRATAFAAGAP